MDLKVVGAGLPRTGTSSLRKALEHLLGGKCCHMSAIPDHPFDLGEGWQRAIAGKEVDWDQLMKPYTAAVDWPASLFWKELSEANPNALVLLSVRKNPDGWWESVNETIMKPARMAFSQDWEEGTDLLKLFERFAGTTEWDRPEVLKEAYVRHNDKVRETIPPERLLEWHASEGWEPICEALGRQVPDHPFPWVNKREDWG